MSNKEMIEHLKANNPYPVDIFTEPDETEWKAVAGALRHFNISPDRIFGAWGRKVWNNCTNETERLLNDKQ